MTVSQLQGHVTTKSEKRLWDTETDPFSRKLGTHFNLETKLQAPIIAMINPTYSLIGWSRFTITVELETELQSPTQTACLPYVLNKAAHKDVIILILGHYQDVQLTEDVRLFPLWYLQSRMGEFTGLLSPQHANGKLSQHVCVTCLVKDIATGIPTDSLVRPYYIDL